MLHPAAHLPTVRRLEREYRAACTREERAATVEAAQRLAAHSDRVARRLAAARDGLTIEAPRTRRNLARGAFAALATIGRVIERAMVRAASLRKATIAARAARALRNAARAVRLSVRRAVAAVVALVVASPAIAEAHPGHDGGLHDMNAGGAVVLVGVALGLASHAWATWGPRRRLVAAVDGGGPIAGGPSPEPEPAETPEPEHAAKSTRPGKMPPQVYECGRDDCPGTTGTSHRRDACPGHASRPDHYTLTLADGRTVTGPIHGSGGTIPARQHDRVQREIDRANDGDRLGICEPAPGCASMHTPSGGRLTIDLRGARLHR